MEHQPTTGQWEIVDAYSDGASIDAITRIGGRVEVTSTGLDGVDLRVSVHDLDGATLESMTCAVNVGATSTCGVSADATDAVTARVSIMVDGIAVTFEERLVAATD